MYTEYATDPIVQMLAFEDQRHFVMALCMKGSGLLDRAYPTDEFRQRVIAAALGLDPTACAEAARRLKEAGLIDDRWQPIKWEKRQFSSDHNAAERKRKQRERDSHTDVTADGCDSHAPDTDTESERDADKNPPNPPGGGAGAAKPRKLPPDFHDQVLAAYHEHLPELPAVRDWSTDRRRKLEDRVAERVKAGKPADQVDYWQGVFRKVAASDFLCGRKSDWRCPGLAWLLKRENFRKVIEGAYDNTQANGAHHAR